MSVQENRILPGTAMDAFHQLVKDISQFLGPSAGIDSADVDHEDLRALMEAYPSNEKEWKRYALRDGSRHYTRNLVDKGNGKSNLLILVWSPGKESPVHDHSGAHCLMKILKGELKEAVYNWPDQCLVKDGKPAPTTVKKETIYSTNQVAYISDKIGLHRISNPDPENFAVSLHLYTPPYGSCKTYNEATGKSVNVPQCNYFSDFSGVVTKL